MTGIERWSDVLDAAIREGDRARAVTAALDAVASGSAGIAEVHDALSSLLTALGDSWRTGTTEVWQEHVASAIVRTVVEALYPVVLAGAPEPTRGTVVLACPENESHDLGLRMLADRLTLAGWDVRYLGADTPAGEIARAAVDADARLIVLSVSTHYHRVRVRETLRVLDTEAPAARVVVGGPAFRGEAAHDAAGHPFDPAELFGSGAIPASSGREGV